MDHRLSAMDLLTTYNLLLTTSMSINKLQYISQSSNSLSHLAAIESALKAGCKWVQLRVKNETPVKVLEIAKLAKILCDRYKAKLIINDNPEVAKEVQAYGVHVGLLDMPIAEVRQLVGNEMIIGGTANTFEHVKLHAVQGADYVGVGPLRFTTTKDMLSPILGLEGYATILAQMNAEGISIPLIAIGGIIADDIIELMQIGVHGVAVSGSITHAENRQQVFKEMNISLNTVLHEG